MNDLKQTSLNIKNNEVEVKITSSKDGSIHKIILICSGGEQLINRLVTTGELAHLTSALQSYSTILQNK